jgi:hypothetical protein
MSLATEPPLTCTTIDEVTELRSAPLLTTKLQGYFIRTPDRVRKQFRKENPGLWVSAKIRIVQWARLDSLPISHITPPLNSQLSLDLIYKRTIVP